MIDEGSTELPTLFEDLLEWKLPGGEAEGNTNSDHFDFDKMEDEQDDSTFQSRPSSASDTATAIDRSLYEVCNRAPAKLGVQ